MSNVVQFRQRSAFAEVIKNLIKLGYLHPSKRLDEAAIEGALVRLEQALCRNLVIAMAPNSATASSPIDIQPDAPVARATRLKVQADCLPDFLRK